MNGGALAGPPIGPDDQPLLWGGRLSISAALTVNALAGAGIVGMLFMVGVRLTGNPRAALLMAIAAGVATLVMSEATHLYNHALSAVMLITAFWLFSGREVTKLKARAVFGGLALGVAMMSRPNAGPTAIVIWLYGAAAAWKLVGDAPDRWRQAIRRSVLAALGPMAGAACYLYFNYLRFGSVVRFGYDFAGEIPGYTGREKLVFDPHQIAKAWAGYLVSPSLSIFLFAPPLILAIVAGRRAYRRWPLEASALIWQRWCISSVYRFTRTGTATCRTDPETCWRRLCC